MSIMRTCRIVVGFIFIIASSILFVGTVMSKRVFVTGGNKGVGKAICEKILKDFPDTCVCLGARDSARGEAAVESIAQAIGDKSRIEFVNIDVSDDASVATAASTMLEKYGPGSFFGLVNNAGIGFGNSLTDTVQINAYGPKRVTEAFLPLLKRPGGRVVNIASASGPMFVAKLGGGDAQRSVFLDPATTWEQLHAQIQARIASTGNSDQDAYGFSKACLNMYTMQAAQQYSDLVISSCTPGFIDTDLTAGMGATGTPEQGARSPLYCLFDESAGTGCYYGSDAVRSPLDRYRGPGDPPYIP